MNSKIVILDDSVILYQHYIGDDKWESVMAFPRGGLTYLIKNNNIKFFAYIDYFYRNCLMTMDLPIYIVDEELGIDGEYDDIEEITEILNRIFPALNGEVDLTPYLKKREAEETYQHIGDYFDEVEYDSSGKTIDFYSQGTLVDSIDATDFIKDGMVDSVSLIELSGDTYLHIVFNTDAGKEPIDINLGDLFDADNYYTKDETDGLLGDKLDASAYTPTDLSNYYNKQEVDELIPSLSGYATEQWVESQGYLTEHQSLSGYATETWVQNQGYINQIKTINNISLIGEGNIDIGSGGTIDAYTKAEADERFQPKGDYVSNTTFNQYIFNITQQITSLQDAIERCCSGQTGETLYRWVTLTGPNDYICSGTTKYAKEQKQQSTDNGATWQNVSPAEYRTGALLEIDSTDCGYAPEPQYRWKAAPTSDYLCIGTDKYYKVYYEVSYDNGVTWQHVVPEQTKRGDLIESASTDCGYIEPQYRWYQAPASDYMCSGTSKYYKEYYQVSNDGGQTWTNVTPVQTRRGALIEAQSTDCGYVPPIEPQYRWINTSSTTCSGYNKVYVSRQQVSYDGGTTWQNTSVTGYGSTIEVNSYDCGYVGNPKIRTITNQGASYQVNCNSSSVLTQTEVNRCFDATEDSGCTVNVLIGDCVTHIGSGSTVTRIHANCMTAVTISNSVQYIGGGTFENCSNLTGATLPSSLTRIESIAFKNCSGMTSIDIPSGVTYIGTACFSGCSGLQAIIVRATTPPVLGGTGVFENGNSCPIKVPSGSVNAYKTAWGSYASRIEAI